MASFVGLLHIGLSGTGALTADVLQRSAAGVYSSVDTATGAASDVGSLVVYQGRLYASWLNYDGTVEKVRRTSDGSSWAEVNTLTQAGTQPPLLFNTGGKLFWIFPGSTGVGYSADGATWTNPTITAPGGGMGYALAWFKI